MKKLVPTGAPKLLLAVLALAAGGGLCAEAQPQQEAGSVQQQGDSSSRKTGHKVTRHTTVEDDSSTSSDLRKAEDLLQKQNFVEAEPLLQNIVQQDSSNYVAWFDLGFTENGLGKMNESIAAYRKSVEVKSDVFESNLNLGLQLAKAEHPDAEKFLRAATQLKPTSHVDEGRARAYLSLAHVIEARRPDEALAAYRQTAALQPKDPEPHLSAGILLEKQNKYADAEQEYRLAQSLDPSSLDAATGLANIYMRGRRFPDAATELRKIVAAHPNQAALHVQLGRVLAAEEKNDEAIAELENLRNRLPQPCTRGSCEATNIHQVALLIARCALERLESRGAHYRTDYPDRDDVHFKNHSVLRRERIRFE